MSKTTMNATITGIIAILLISLASIVAISWIKEVEIREREETARHTLCLESTDPSMCIALSSKEQGHA